MVNKFKTGDKVLTPAGTEAIVTKVRGDSIEVKYSKLGGSRSFKESDLKFNYQHLREDRESQLPETCPVCRSKWKKTKFGSTTWYDCITCRDTAESIVDREKSKGNTVSSYNYFSPL